MPGYVIHLAIAEKYLEKNINEKDNEFIDGVIYPDEVDNKYKTHYWNEMRSVNLYNFLKAHKIDTSFNRGYFLHLLTDYLFYNRYIEYWSTDIYTDYDYGWSNQVISMDWETMSAVILILKAPLEDRDRLMDEYELTILYKQGYQPVLVLTDKD